MYCMLIYIIHLNECAYVGYVSDAKKLACAQINEKRKRNKVNQSMVKIPYAHRTHTLTKEKNKVIEKMRRK